MIERLEVTPGAGTVIRYGGIVAWADPSASAALISFLAQSARNLSPSPRGGRQIADHIAGVLGSRDPEPHVAFAVIGPSDHGWASLLHGPVQAWDGARWLAPTPTPGWLQAIITPRPAITVSAAGTPTPAPEPDAMWDLEAGVVPGSGFVLVPSGVPGRYATVRPPVEDHLQYQRDVMVPEGDDSAEVPVEPVVAMTTALPAVEPTLLLGSMVDDTEAGAATGPGEPEPEHEPAPARAAGGGAGAAAAAGAALGAAALWGREGGSGSDDDSESGQNVAAAAALAAGAGAATTRADAEDTGEAVAGAALAEPGSEAATDTPADARDTASPTAGEHADEPAPATAIAAPGLEPEPEPEAEPEFEPTEVVAAAVAGAGESELEPEAEPEFEPTEVVAAAVAGAGEPELVPHLDETGPGGNGAATVADGPSAIDAAAGGEEAAAVAARRAEAEPDPAPEGLASAAQPAAVSPAPPRRAAAPGPAGSVDLRTVATTAGAPLPVGGGPDQRIPGAPVVAGILCARGHLNRPGLTVCARCRTVLPDAKEQVSGTRPPLGALIDDQGAVYRLDRGYLVGSAPGRDPTVGGGLARPLVLHGNDVSGSHAEFRLADWDVLIVDRGSAAGTCLYEPGASEWARLNPFEPRALAPGSHVAFGQRVVTFLSPWVTQD